MSASIRSDHRHPTPVIGSHVGRTSFDLTDGQTRKKSTPYLLHKGQGAGVSDGGGSIGHRTHHGDSSCQSSCCPGGEVLLVCGAGLPQVNMHVDQT